MSRATELVSNVERIEVYPVERRQNWGRREDDLPRNVEGIGLMTALTLLVFGAIIGSAFTAVAWWLHALY